MLDENFWQGKRVFLTGHTGFKGSWMALLLHKLGAEVKGYSLPAPTNTNLFSTLIQYLPIENVEGDIRDVERLKKEVSIFSPDIIIHMAAQALVRKSYQDPIDTFSTNIMGTVNLFESARASTSVQTILNVTTDKCYQNNEWQWGYRENEPLGGKDPYSSSKACAELVTSAYAHSFFNENSITLRKINIATARAGNVIGGGDWAPDRLITDVISSLNNNETVTLRNPSATRPWQHVFDAITGYLMLVEKLHQQGSEFEGAWNFGPNNSGMLSVEELISLITRAWGENANYEVDCSPQPHEAHFLKLDCSKANSMLKWQPCWTIEQTIQELVQWNKYWNTYNQDHNKIYQYCETSLSQYLSYRKNNVCR